MNLSLQHVGMLEDHKDRLNRLTPSDLSCAAALSAPGRRPGETVTHCDVWPLRGGLLGFKSFQSQSGRFTNSPPVCKEWL